MNEFTHPPINTHLIIQLGIIQPIMDTKHCPTLTLMNCKIAIVPIEKWNQSLTLPFCSETKLLLVLASDSTALPEPTFASEKRQKTKC